jgi:Bacterial PH domain
VSGDYDFEPVRGLPARLPAGEALLWQGHPEWRSLSVRAFHLRKIVFYFGLLALWSVASALADGKNPGGALLSAAWIPVMALAAVVPLAVLACLAARTSVYSITSKRIVVRIGIALPITINIPFRVIESIGLKRHTDGSGDIPASLSKGYRLAFLVLWPHARPWRVRSPQPMLRSIADPDRVARLLVEAISADAAQALRPVPAALPEPDRRPVQPAPVSAAA